MKKNGRFLRVITALMAVLMLVMCNASALAAFSARINSSSAKVYKYPSTGSIYVKGGYNRVVTVTGYSSTWARITYKGNVGYIPTKYLDMTSRKLGYTVKKTPVYRGASTSSGSIGTLGFGKPVYVVGMYGDYYRIQNASGSVTGYVRKGSLATYSQMRAMYNKYMNSGSGSSSSKPSGSTGSSGSSGSTGTGTVTGGSSSGSTSTSKVDKVIAEAKKHIGKTYASSDNPPSTFNCSSFVEYCFEQHGYNMKGTAANQASDGNYTRIDSLSSVKKGDVLCFDTNDDGTVDHTAIALVDGGGSFIEASENAGKVQTNTMTAWYRERFILARRII